MNKIATILSVLVVSATVVSAEDKARAILEQAIQAQGGEAKVAKLRTTITPKLLWFLAI